MSAKCHERTYLSATASADWLATRIPFACSRPPAARQQSGISSKEPGTIDELVDVLRKNKKEI